MGNLLLDDWCRASIHSYAREDVLEIINAPAATGDCSTNHLLIEALARVYRRRHRSLRDATGCSAKLRPIVTAQPKN